MSSLKCRTSFFVLGLHARPVLVKIKNQIIEKRGKRSTASRVGHCQDFRAPPRCDGVTENEKFRSEDQHHLIRIANPPENTHVLGTPPLADICGQNLRSPCLYILPISNQVYLYLGDASRLRAASLFDSNKPGRTYVSFNDFATGIYLFRLSLSYSRWMELRKIRSCISILTTYL